MGSISLRNISAVTFAIAIFLSAIGIRGCVKSNYDFANKYEYAWNLSEKSSTIESKSNYINEFVNTLISNKNEFASNDAIWLKTKDNSFESNIEALVTLRNRLDEIKTMDQSSFQYNTAIQQITAQEQGEGGGIIAVIQGCYDLKNYTYVWGWFGLILLLTTTVLFAISLNCIVLKW